MDIGNDVRSRQREHIIIALQLSGDVIKTVSPKVCLPETILLDLRSHRSIEDENPFLDYIVKSNHYSLITIHL